MKTVTTVVVFLSIIHCFGATLNNGATPDSTNPKTEENSSSAERNPQASQEATLNDGATPSHSVDLRNRTPLPPAEGTPPTPTSSNVAKPESLQKKSIENPEPLSEQKSGSGSSALKTPPPPTSPNLVQSPQPSTTETTPGALPEDNADWESIRADKRAYIDKTPFLIKLLERSGKLWFLTRPRRFGKSMFLDMMNDFFLGNQEMFRGLKISEYGNTKFMEDYMPPTVGNRSKWVQFPVIYLNFASFATLFETIEEWKAKYVKKLRCIATDDLEIDSADSSIDEVGSLIKIAKRKFNNFPVIVLIDEYDHPFQRAFIELNNTELAGKVKQTLNGIMTEIKNSVRYLGLALVTGVSKLAVNALESGPNNFVDLTNEIDLAGAFGFDETEIKDNLGPHLKHFSTNRIEAPIGSTKPEDRIMEELKSWYDGYRFNIEGKICKVLNPVSTMKCLRWQRFKEYWTATGSIDYLVRRFYEEGFTWDVLKEGIQTDLKTIQEKLNPLEVVIPLRIWMLLFGYYTISSYNERTELISLKMPNKEIEITIENELASYDPDKKAYFKKCYSAKLDSINRALDTGDIKLAMHLLEQFVFTSYKAPLNKEVSGEEVQRRLEMLLRSANVFIEYCAQFCKDIQPKSTGGDVDMHTTNLKKKYVIEIKCLNKMKEGKTANSAISQLLTYMRDQPKSFMNAIENPDEFHLMGLQFDITKGIAKLTDWISLPVIKNGIPKFSEVIGKNENTVRKFTEVVQPNFQDLDPS